MSGEGTRYHLVSGGAGSWLAAKVDMEAHPTSDHRFWFADTLYEDADCYRFLLEGVAYLVGRKITVPRAEDFPDYRVSGDFNIAEYHGNTVWREFLSDLRAEATSTLPELTWLVEGRDPIEVFRDERFLGNSKIDPCSKNLKRIVLDKHRAEAADPETAVFCVGIGPHEAHRFEGRGARKGLRRRMQDDGWIYAAPLLGTKAGEYGPFGYLADAGITRPRLYRSGYVHNNCGGFCIKAGHAHYLNRLRSHPERFAYDAMMERKLAEYIGEPVSMLTDRRGDGLKKRLTLDDFASRITADTLFDYEPGDSGCGCMIETEPTP